MTSVRVGLLAWLALFAAAESSRALDTVTQLGSATPARGNISKVTRDGLVMTRRLGEPVTIPANDIASVRWDGEPAKLNLARGDEQAGRFQKALDVYEVVLTEIASGRIELKHDVQFLIARTKARLALADVARMEEAIRGLEEFRTSASDSFRHYEAVQWLGQLYMARGDYERAQQTFQEFGKAPWQDYRMAAKSWIAQTLLAQGQVDAAQAMFEEVLAQPAQEPAVRARQFEAMVGKATCLIRRMEYDQALATLAVVVQQAPGENSRLQATAYLRQGDTLQAMGKTKEAVLAYLHIPVLFPGEADLNAESLYHLSRLWIAVDRPERAANARAELENSYPESRWAKKLINVTEP